MFRKCRRVVAAAVACVLITGIAAYAQVAQKPRNQNPARQQAIQQRMQQRQGPAGAPEGRFRKQQQPPMMGNLQGMLLPPSPQVIEKLAVRLGLSDAQKQQIKQLYAGYADTTKTIREKRMANLKAFMTAFKDPKVSKADLERLSEPILQADKAILDAEFDFWLGLRGTLNVQQQSQLQSFMLERQGMGQQPQPPAPRTRGVKPPAPAK